MTNCHDFVIFVMSYDDLSYCIKLPQEIFLTNHCYFLINFNMTRICEGTIFENKLVETIKNTKI